MRKKFFIVVMLAIVLAGIWVTMRGTIFRVSRRTQGEITREDLIQASRRSLVDTVSSSGYLETIRERQLYFTISGTVDKVHVSKGDMVEAGEILIELENKQQKLSLLEARNAYERSLIDGTSGQIEERKLSYEIAEKNLNSTILAAPFPGLIVNVEVEEGDYLPAGEPVGRLIDESSYLIEVDIGELDIPMLEEGQSVKIRINAIPNEVFKGEIIDIGHTAMRREGIVSVPVIIAVKDNDSRFKPGYSANIEIVVVEKEDVLVVPISSIFSEDGNDYVIKYTEDSLEIVQIETGLTAGIYAEIKSGLTDDSKVLINAYEYAHLSVNELHGIFTGRGGRW